MPNTHNRVGIAGTVYHQNPGQNPTAMPLRCSMSLQKEEETFSRSPPEPVGEKWQKLNLGWLPKCSMLCIRNDEKAGGSTLFLGGGIPVVSLLLSIPPGMVTVLYPTAGLWLRCVDGKARYSLFAVPE